MKSFTLFFIFLVSFFEMNGQFIRMFPRWNSKVTSSWNSSSEIASTAQANSLDSISSSSMVSSIDSSSNVTSSTSSPELTTIPSTSLEVKEPLKVLLIGGHGTLTRDPGATYLGRYEYAYNQALVNSVKTLLEGDSTVQIVTEPSPMIASEEMTLISQSDVDMVLNIHFNAGKGTGSEMIVPFFISDLSFARSVLQGFQRFGQPLRLTSIYSRSSSGKVARTQDVAMSGTDYYGVIRAGANVRIPSYILETEFIDNEAQMAFYDSHQAQFATQIAQSLKDYAARLN